MSAGRGDAVISEQQRRRLYVESWSPTYGAPLENAVADAAYVVVDPTVETAVWHPVTPDARPPPMTVAFVDGVRRVEARLTLDHPTDGPVGGIVGAFGVGAVVWDRAGRQSTWRDLSVQRIVAMSRGHRVVLGRVGNLLRSTPQGSVATTP